MSPEWDAIIIGSGFSGLAMANRLQRQHGYRFLVLEQADRVGGTWRDNRYPGCACDVPSHLYSLSFAPNPDWQQHFSGQEEIRRYLEEISLPLKPHLRLDARVMKAEFDEIRLRWIVSLENGEQLACRFLMAGLGPLNRPRIPDIPGLAEFSGTLFHSMDWPASLDVSGKRVAVIGTGASAIQIVPAIVPRVREITVFQRTAPWVVPKGNAEYSPQARYRFRKWPGWRCLYRSWLYFSHEIRGLAFLWPPLMRLVASAALRRLRRKVRDPRLREQLTPHYMPGCKRIMLSDDYYEALLQPNATLVTSPIRRITPTGIMTTDGREIPVDVLVLATGFRHAQTPASPLIRGRAGITLQQAWEQQRVAYLGTMVAGFPNLFLLAGPNIGLGHNSIVFMIEAQVRWILKALQAMRARGARTISPSEASYQRTGAEIRRRSLGTVWKSGCNSWYLDEHGNNAAIWPGLSLEFWLRTRRFMQKDFILEAHAPPPP